MKKSYKVTLVTREKGTYIRTKKFLKNKNALICACENRVTL